MKLFLELPDEILGFALVLASIDIPITYFDTRPYLEATECQDAYMPELPGYAFKTPKINLQRGTRPCCPNIIYTHFSFLQTSGQCFPEVCLQKMVSGVRLRFTVGGVAPRDRRRAR
jgi:hypothetical protein